MNDRESLIFFCEFTREIKKKMKHERSAQAPPVREEVT